MEQNSLNWTFDYNVLIKDVKFQDTSTDSRLNLIIIDFVQRPTTLKVKQFTKLE